MEKFIKELNENSKLKYKIGIDIPKSFNGEFKKINNYMSIDVYEPDKKDYDRFISFYGYPTDENKRILANYKINNENEDVFGIKIKTKFEDAKKILSNYGYIQENDSTFKKENLIIQLNYDKGIITNIEIKLESKYLGNKLY